MKVYKFLYRFFLFLVVFSCKSKKENGDKNSNDIEKIQVTTNGVDKLGDDIYYNAKNFKDRDIKYSFFGEEFYGQKKTNLLDGIYYTAAILPKEYYLKKNLKIKDSISYYKEKMKNEEVVQFDVQLEDLTKTIDKRRFSQMSYEEYIKYLSFAIKKDFQAITVHGDTIVPSGVLFERTYKLTPRRRILLYFSFPDEIEKIKLVYNDVLYGNNFIKFGLRK